MSATAGSVKDGLEPVNAAPVFSMSFIGAIIALSLLGLVMVASASTTVAPRCHCNRFRILSNNLRFPFTFA